jgi:pimeloyl-ACP methyl ester carboxylesterase
LWSDSDWIARFVGNDKALLDSYRACFRLLREETIAGASHMMHHDQPAAFARAIEAFMTAAS